jgi:hypothetical protein
MDSMENKIQEALSVIVGLPLWAVGRASDLAWFEFGSRRTVQGTKGVKEVGDYALHVQCAWRITQADKIVTGRRDIFCTPTEAIEPTSDDFDWQRDNRFDRMVKQLFQNESRQFQVQSVHAGEAGSFTLALEDGYKLDVFPQDSESGEHWRLFKPYSEEPHLVFSGNGLQLE